MKAYRAQGLRELGDEVVRWRWEMEMEIDATMD